jgi:hypothetical protein
MQINVFEENILDGVDNVVIEYHPKTNSGIILTHTKGYYNDFYSVCQRNKILTSDFDLVRNDPANIVYQASSWINQGIYAVIFSPLLKKNPEFLKYSFLIGASLIGISLGAVQLAKDVFGVNRTTTGPVYFIADSIRRATIAQNIDDYVSKNPGKKVGILYPPVHCAWIKYFLERPYIRMVFYKIGQLIYPESAKHPIFVNPN